VGKQGEGGGGGGGGERRGRTARRQDGTRRQSTLPDDRELARSSPAFIVINWIVRAER